MQKMRVSSVVSEAMRNLVSGTTRAAVLAVVFMVAVGTVAMVDVRSMISIVQGAAQYRAAGASVHVLKAEGSIDGRRCDALSSTGVLTHASAMRRSGTLQILNMPASQITVVEATPGIASFLSVVAQPVGYDTDINGGVWLSADLAQVLGVAPGRIVHTARGKVIVVAVFTWPDDGRARDLGYTILIPVPADGVFDQCWTEAWPSSDDLAHLAYVSLISGAQQSQVTFAQLNPSFGSDYDIAGLLAHRLTARAPWASALIGLSLGYVAVRLRRLEIASALHARVSKVDVIWQLLFETVMWVLAASVVISVALLWGSRIGNPDPSWIWARSLRIVSAAALACLIGAIMTITTTSEKHLFQYSKDR